MENGEFRVADTKSVESIQKVRKNQLINVFERVKPDCLITEFFPFGRHLLLFELLPLLEYIKSTAPHTKIICSLRDVIGKVSDIQEEDTICYLMNKYFDLLLFHSDANFQIFAESFTRHQDINCPITHTGFIAQALKESCGNLWSNNGDFAKILVSVGGGRIGQEVLQTVIEASVIVSKKIKHEIQIFAGPFIPEDKFVNLQQAAKNQPNIKIAKYTQNLLEYMNTADISISLSGYNTAMNILSTRVKAIVVPLSHNDQDKEQLHRTQKLEDLGVVEVIHPDNLNPAYLANAVIKSLSTKHKESKQQVFDLNGAENTNAFLQRFLNKTSLIPSY
ncbi:glycosyltransferase family protein [Synechocystis sp. PCC 7509]|uniref:glycosyltransferase family protein n=1 Tax=Synechocystis sp. PCC 7509 TaxID=927677 RepID=UPI00192C856C|nr:glycosyltransferase [Synechocystis sp. PCC 7509]